MSETEILRERINAISKSVLIGFNALNENSKPNIKSKTMKENEEANLENPIEEKIKLGTEGTYGKRNCVSPFAIILNHPAHDPDPYVCPWPSFAKAMSVYGKYCTYHYYEPRMAYLKIATKKLEELKEFAEYESISKIIEDFGVRATDVIKAMEEKKTPIRCVGDSEIRQACFLVHARINLQLTKKHWRDLPEGQELLEDFQKRYEDLCTSLKLKPITFNRKQNLNQSNTNNLKSEN